MITMRWVKQSTAERIVFFSRLRRKCHNPGVLHIPPMREDVEDPRSTSEVCLELASRRRGKGNHVLVNVEYSGTRKGHTVTWRENWVLTQSEFALREEEGLNG